MEVSEVGTNGFGHELCLVIPQERSLDVVPLGEVDAREVLEASIPIIGIISEKTCELIDFAFIGSPLSNPGGFVETVDVVPGFD